MDFAAGDRIELALAAVFLFFAIVWRPWIEPCAKRFADHTVWCMIFLAVLPVALRLALLHRYPAPIPDIYDEFGHLFVADTLRHFRLANPPHPLPQFFETFFILQQPTYSSIYPIGQGLALAAGWTIFATPWAGVLLSVAALCSLAYWMLRGWTTAGWALAGGMLAVIEFGPLNMWTNTYWGGAFPAAAGCLVYGVLPRLRARFTIRDSVLLGLGFAMHLLSRPYESVWLLLSVVLFAQPDFRKMLRPALIATLVVLPAAGVIILQNKRVTGSWTTLPYQLSQQQYGVPATLTFQPQAVPHRTLTREQQLDYEMQRNFRTSGYWFQLWYRLRYYRFFFYPPLFPALAAFLVTARGYSSIWVILTAVLFALGTNFFPAFQYHYLAAIVCLFLLMSIRGLEALERLPGLQIIPRLLLYICAFQFGYQYLFQPGIRPNSARRAEIAKAVSHIPGDILIFVRYWPQHVFQEEWVWNSAAIDGSRVVWARDLGEPENGKLRAYFPHRGEWLLQADARPLVLAPYKPEQSLALPPAPDQPKKPEANKPAPLRFENVR